MSFSLRIETLSEWVLLNRAHQSRFCLAAYEFPGVIYHRIKHSRMLMPPNAAVPRWPNAPASTVMQAPSGTTNLLFQQMYGAQLHPRLQYQPSVDCEFSSAL